MITWIVTGKDTHNNRIERDPLNHEGQFSVQRKNSYENSDKLVVYI